MNNTDVLYAVLSDIHANYPALQQVDADARGQAQAMGCELRFICLGDVVDYGPFPNECMAWVDRVKPDIVLQGNHDAEAIQPATAEMRRVGKQWFPITYWTRSALTSEHRSVIGTWAGKRAGSNGMGDFLFFHSDPTASDHYIEDCSMARDYLFHHTRRWRYGLFGHTHYQTLFIKEGRGCAERFAQPENKRHDAIYHRAVNTWMELPERVLMLNPGSVGQPRFHAAQMGAQDDNRACYLLLQRRSNAWRMQWRRVEYDLHVTVDALGRLAWPQQPVNHGNDILKATKDTGRLAMPYLDQQQLHIQQAEFPAVINLLIDTLLQRKSSTL